jgi:Fe2+ transport system protein FeoA
MASTLKLSQLPVGSRAVVRGFPDQGAALVRLREMGVLLGTSLALVRTAPTISPCAGAKPSTSSSNRWRVEKRGFGVNRSLILAPLG